MSAVNLSSQSIDPSPHDGKHEVVGSESWVLSPIILGNDVERICETNQEDYQDEQEGDHIFGNLNDHPDNRTRSVDDPTEVEKFQPHHAGSTCSNWHEVSLIVPVELINEARSCG